MKTVIIADQRWVAREDGRRYLEILAVNMVPGTDDVFFSVCNSDDCYAAKETMITETTAVLEPDFSKKHSRKKLGL